MTRNIYFFDDPPPVDWADRRAILGGKGAGLAEMTAKLKLPVPYGFTIPTTLCAELAAGELPQGLQESVRMGVRQVEMRMGHGFGDSGDPLFLSVRSGAAESMPGMMDTVLNVGATPNTVAALAAQSSHDFAADSYARFLLMFGRIVLGVPESHLVASLAKPADQSIDLLRETLSKFLPLTRLDDPWQQLYLSIVAVFRSWNSARAILYRERQGLLDGGTAATIQAMVFGNRDESSGTGVYFTRDPNSGQPLPYGDYLWRAQGEDVVAGTHRTLKLESLRERQPENYAKLIEVGTVLERRYRDMCDIEFTIESGRLWLLQVRAAKRSALAAVRVALDLSESEQISLEPTEAFARITPEAAVKAEEALRGMSGPDTPIAKGLPASPGIASGRAYFSADDAADAADRGEAVIFVAQATSPSDLHGFEAAKGILTSTGGVVSHASLVAREFNIPAVVGAAQVDIGERALRAGSTTVREGEVITIDGTTGALYAGEVTARGAVDQESVLERLRVFCGRFVQPQPMGEPLERLVARARSAVLDDPPPMNPSASPGPPQI